MATLHPYYHSGGALWATVHHSILLVHFGTEPSLQQIIVIMRSSRTFVVAVAFLKTIVCSIELSSKCVAVGDVVAVVVDVGAGHAVVEIIFAVTMSSRTERYDGVNDVTSCLVLDVVEIKYSSLSEPFLCGA